MEFEKLDQDRLDHDIEYRRQMIQKVFRDLDEMQEFHEGLSAEGQIIGDVMLKKISEIRKEMLILEATIYDGLAQ